MIGLLRGLAFAALFWSTTANATATADAETAISAGLEAATKGEIGDRTLVADLVKAFESKDSSVAARVSAAYLLTFATAGLTPAPAATYADFALSRPEGPETLGLEGVTRLYRIRGDQAYDDAKFDLARDSYAKLKAISKGALADYATLRLGWTCMNQDDASAAFRLWTESATAKTAAKQPLSPSLLHGIGQSFTENGTRTGVDAATIAALATTPEAKAQLVRGLADGVPYLKATEKLKTWRATLAALPFWSDVIGRVFEVASGQGERSCDLLSLLVSDPRPSLPSDPYARVIEACAGTKGKSPHLGAVYAKLDAKGEERLARFQYRKTAEPAEACREGIAWIAEGGAPVEQIVVACNSTVVAGSARPVAAALLAGSADRFKKENDPALHLVAALAKHKAFVDELSVAVLATPETYRGTLLPTLLAESHFTRGEIDRAEAFRAKFGGDAFPVWTRILSAKARRLNDGKPAEAKALLIAAGKTPSAETWPLWLPILTKLAGDPSEKAFVSSTAAAALTAGPGKDPVVVAAWIELGAGQKLWNEVWIALKRADAEGASYLSEKLEADLFEAIASREIRADGAEKISDARLKAVVTTGLAFAAGNPVDGIVWPKKSSTPLAKDVARLQGLERRQAAALKPRKDSVAQVSAWVPFLASTTSELKRRPWVSPRFRERALGLLDAFCAKADERLGTLPPAAQVGAGEWAQVVTQLHGRLADGRRWVAATREKGKETIGE